MIASVKSYETKNIERNNRYEVERCSSSTAVTVFLNTHPNIEIISITCSMDNYSEHFYVFYKNKTNKREKSNNK
jgi:hypothetical protein